MYCLTFWKLKVWDQSVGGINSFLGINSMPLSYQFCWHPWRPWLTGTSPQSLPSYSHDIVSMSMSLSMSSFLLFIRTLSYWVQARPNGLILTHLQRPHFQIRPHLWTLRVKTSTSLTGIQFNHRMVMVKKVWNTSGEVFLFHISLNP